MHLVHGPEHRGWPPRVGKNRQVSNAEQTPPPELLLVKDPTNPEEADALVLDEVPVQQGVAHEKYFTGL